MLPLIRNSKALLWWKKLPQSQQFPSADRRCSMTDLLSICSWHLFTQLPNTKSLIGRMIHVSSWSLVLAHRVLHFQYLLKLYRDLGIEICTTGFIGFVEECQLHIVRMAVNTVYNSKVLERILYIFPGIGDELECFERFACLVNASINSTCPRRKYAKREFLAIF